MSVSNQRPKYCMDCAHFVTPSYSAAECRAPGVYEGMQTRQCRDTDGACGPLAKLWKKKNEFMGQT